MRNIDVVGLNMEGIKASERGNIQVQCDGAVRSCYSSGIEFSFGSRIFTNHNRHVWNGIADWSHGLDANVSQIGLRRIERLLAAGREGEERKNSGTQATAVWKVVLHNVVLKSKSDL